MAIYYILLAAVAAGGWYLWEYKQSPVGQKCYLILVAAALVAMATLRYSIGFDYFSYQEIFEKIAAASWAELPAAFGEFPGYALINKIVAMLGGSYRVLLLVCNLFMTWAVFHVIRKYSSMPWMGVFLYITLQFFAHSMNLLRQSIAATVLLLGYGFLRDRKPLPYLAVVLAAASIHYSALVMLPVYFLINLPADWKRMLAVGVPALICYIFSEEIFTLVTSVVFQDYAHYKDSIYWGGNGFHYVVVPAIYFGAVLLFRRRLLEKDSRNRILINSAYYTFILYVFITKHFILERFSIYVFPLAMLLIPEILELFTVEKLPDTAAAGKMTRADREAKIRVKNQKFYRAWAIGTVLFACIVYFGFAAARGFHKVYPYISIFNQEAAVDNNDYIQGER